MASRIRVCKQARRPCRHARVQIHMSPYGYIWVHMCRYGSIWGHMSSYGSIYVHMGPCRSHMGPYGHIWVHISPYGSIWVHGQAQAGQAGNGWLGWQKATVASGLDLRLSMNQQRRGHLRCAKLKYNHIAFQNKRR